MSATPSGAGGPEGRESTATRAGDAAATELIAPSEAAYPSPKYAWYVVAVLTVAYISSFIDRQILSLLVPPMRRDLGISDTQMSLLMGLSFAIFYTILGLPIARLADSRSRRTIIAVGIAVWSFMTALCGAVKRYSHLLLARVGVGVGEATLSPAAYSLIADYFPRDRLATAISVYSMGIYLGSGIAVFLGGALVGLISMEGTWQLPLVGSVYPWQTIFFMIGLPGILIAALMYTVREPERRGSQATTATDVPIGEVAAYIRRNGRTFFCHNLGFGLLYLVSYGAAAWNPTFLIRTHGWTAAQAGVWYGIIILIFGTAGIVTGGRVADRLLAKGYTDAKIRVALIAAIAGAPAGAAAVLVPSGTLAMIFLAPATFFASFPVGAAAAAIQEIVPNEMRAQASALYLFVVNLIGLGMGPTAVALVTDYIFADDAMLRYSLLAVGVAAGTIAALLFWAALAPYRRSVARLQDA